MGCTHRGLVEHGGLTRSSGGASCELLGPVELSGSRLPHDESRHHAWHRHDDLLVDPRTAIGRYEIQLGVQAYAPWAVNILDHPVSRGVRRIVTRMWLFQIGMPAMRNRSTAVYVVVSPAAAMPDTRTTNGVMPT